MIFLAQLHFQRFDRTQRVGDKGGGIGAPLDNVDFLIVQLAYNVIDARTTYPDTRTDRIKSLLASNYCYFRAATRLTCDRFDLDGTLVNFRNFRFKQTTYQIAMCA